MALSFHETMFRKLSDHFGSCQGTIILASFPSLFCKEKLCGEEQINLEENLLRLGSIAITSYSLTRLSISHHATSPDFSQVEAAGGKEKKNTR